MENEFYDPEGNPLDRSNREIIDKFKAITEIDERPYVSDDLLTSDIAYYAAKEAIQNAGIDQEELDQVISLTILEMWITRTGIPKWCPTSQQE